MKRFLQKGLLCSFFVSASLFSVDAIAQNIFSGEPVQVVGPYNGYATTPYNSDYRTTSFRRVSVSSGTPTDGRGQWATTINVQPSGGNVTPINMPGGGNNNGFLFISGPSSNRFRNKWVFSGVGQGTLNAVNSTVYNTGNDMGLNMSTAGRYTFVMNDVGYTGTNSRYYVGYTTNAPVSVSRASQSFNLTQTVVNITTSATPSSGENVYVRYRVGTNDFSSSTAVVQATGSGTSWTATLPAQACGSTVHYYVYTSTRTLSQINSDSEGDRSLATLRYDDNAGANYSSTLPAAITYYADADGDGFGNPLVTQSSCTGAPVGYVANNTDCNDNQIQYFDGDGDGFGSNVLVACGVANNSDCNDNQLQFVDNDGDGFGQNVYAACGVTNNSDCNDNQLQYQDLDGDGFGNPLVLVACGQANNYDSNDGLLTYVDNDNDGFGQSTYAPSGPTNNSDCNDNQLQYQDLDGDGFGNPAVLVACGQANNYDSNDGLLTYVDNDNDGFGQNTYAPSGPANNSDCNDNQLQYQDLDGDGFGSNVLVACGVVNNSDCNDNQLQYLDNDGDGFGSLTLAACGVTNNTDCDDNDNTKHGTYSFYLDSDGDGVGFGSLVSGVCAVNASTPPSGYSLTNTDCAPNDGLVYQTGMFYTDADGDNYSLDNTQVSLCYGATEPAGYSAVSLGIDCNDSVAAINPGLAEVLYDGFDNNCNGLLDEGNQLISNMTNCGTTLATIGSLISCVSTAGVDGYRFEVTNTTTSAVQTIDRPLQYFSLTQLANYEYATTYSVRVMLRKNGIWLGYYGPSCLYSTPPVTQPSGGTGTTQLQTYCGQTLPSVSTLIATTSLPGATGYRFRVTNTVTGSIQTLTRTLHWFSLTMLPSYNYGTTYVVDVAVKTTGDYSEYGAPCNVTTPNVPTLVNYCGGATVPAKATYIYTSSLDRVTSYRFEVTRYTDETLSTAVDVSQIDRNINWFTFNMVTNYSPNTHYGVRVQVMTSGTWSPWSDACEIVSPASARVTEVSSKEVFSVKGYPNPYDNEFSLQMESSSDARVSIKVYDMVGKLIDTREVQSMDVPTVSLGSRYPSGVYNVVVSQGEHTQTMRMVKR